MGTQPIIQTGGAERSFDYANDFRGLWRSTIRNEILGSAIDSGEVIAGNVGSADRLEYTVIGDLVNRSSRIEQLNKSLGTRLLISERTYGEAGMTGGRELAPVAAKGIDKPLQLYTIGKKGVSGEGSA